MVAQDDFFGFARQTCEAALFDNVGAEEKSVYGL